MAHVCERAQVGPGTAPGAGPLLVIGVFNYGFLWLLTVNC